MSRGQFLLKWRIGLWLNGLEAGGLVLVGNWKCSWDTLIREGGGHLAWQASCDRPVRGWFSMAMSRSRFLLKRLTGPRWNGLTADGLVPIGSWKCSWDNLVREGSGHLA